ncbi:MAG: hypothetical protein WCH91_13335 [bacterium]
MTGTGETVSMERGTAPSTGETGAGRGWKALAAYFASDDPLTGAANRLLVVLLGNQPTYPLFVGWATGEWSPWLVLTMLSTPFFCAVPWASRRYPGTGRLAFPLIGALNGIFCTVVLGRGSGVELFLVPCLVIAAWTCPAGNRRLLAVCMAILYAAFVAGRTLPWGPVIPFTPDQLEALVSLNAYSAASFSALATWNLWGVPNERRA